jgi:hypothetical protein
MSVELTLLYWLAVGFFGGILFGAMWGALRAFGWDWVVWLVVVGVLVLSLLSQGPSGSGGAFPVWWIGLLMFVAMAVGSILSYDEAYDRTMAWRAR